MKKIVDGFLKSKYWVYWFLCLLSVVATPFFIGTLALLQWATKTVG